MAKFVGREHCFEGHKWYKNGDHPDDYLSDFTDPVTGKFYSIKSQKLLDFEGALVRRFRHPRIDGSSPCGVCGIAHHYHGFIDQGTGSKVCPGDWVVKVGDMHYNMSPVDIGKLFYEVKYET